MTGAPIYRSNGRYYGYPTCCIAEFIEGIERRDAAPTDAKYRKANRARFRRQKGKPWEDDGFLPCRKCARVAARDFMKFVAENIAKAAIVRPRV